MDPSNPIDVGRVAFAIANGIKKNGIKNRSNFFNPFEYKNTGVKATLSKAEVKINDRLTELFTSEATISIDRLMQRSLSLLSSYFPQATFKTSINNTDVEGNRSSFIR